MSGDLEPRAMWAVPQHWPLHDPCLHLIQISLPLCSHHSTLDMVMTSVLYLLWWASCPQWGMAAADDSLSLTYQGSLSHMGFQVSLDDKNETGDTYTHTLNQNHPVKHPHKHMLLKLTLNDYPLTIPWWRLLCKFHMLEIDLRWDDKSISAMLRTVP